MPSNNYSQCRFIGYAIPTGPSQDKLIASKYLVGNYLGSDDLEQDLVARVQILQNAVDTAKLALPSDDGLLVNNIFMAPEFFFHGPLGAYVYRDEEDDPAVRALELLEQTFNAQDYPNWTFVFGTMVSAKVANIDAIFESPSVQMRKKLVESLAINAQAEFGNARSVTEQILNQTIAELRINPAVSVRDRALIFSNIDLQIPGQSKAHQKMSSEKYFLSPIDFVLFETNNQNVITEEMVGYPYIDLSNGDTKKNPYDAHAIFRQNYGAGNSPEYMDFGVEICLDHDDARLRKNLEPQGAVSKGNAVHIHLIPSSGSAIVQQCVVADSNGFVFNVDGWCAYDDSSTPQQGDVNGVQSLYASYHDLQNGTQYAAHSQLARINAPAKGNDPNLYPASFQNLDVDNLEVHAVPVPSLDHGAFSDYFAGGSGALHIFGAKQAYVLFP